MYYYCAFGFMIESEIKLNILQEERLSESPDIVIERRDLESELAMLSTNQYERRFHLEQGRVIYDVREGLSFLIENGSGILVSADQDIPDGLLAVYILGGCMGAILYQRGMVPFHGSCVCKNDEALMIVGDSGAGKSTLASEFLRKGWKLLTDDIAVIIFQKGEPYVLPSYPSQKLWEDAISYYGIADKNKKPLYQEERREKYHVDVRAAFCSEAKPLKYVVKVERGFDDYTLEALDGFTVADQMLRTVYRPWLGLREDKNRCFQICVDLISRIRMSLLQYPGGVHVEERLYEMICDEYHISH